jgi:hypothetical protein
MTHDPLVRDHANYHNTQCWSPDGRYLSYVHYAANEREYGAQAASEVHLVDLLTQTGVLVDRGDSPRWANKHNWLFYVRFHPQDGPKTEKGTKVIWLDVDTEKKTRIAYGVYYFKETDCDDRWLYGQRIPDGGLYGTDAKARLRQGQTLTSFETMLIADQCRKTGRLPPKSIRSVVQDMDSPLMWQRSSELYVAVVRSPDRPHVRRSGGGVELIPGENHWEIRGYHLFRDEERITEEPLVPGASLTLPAGDVYRAIAVEWSGLESDRSLPLEIQSAMTLDVLLEIPPDFSWTRMRLLVDGREATGDGATSTSDAVRETVHLHDGVIHREWIEDDQVATRHDLNLEGTPIRQLFFEDGRLVRREYRDRNGGHVSTELFDSDGFITESIHGQHHWWYQRGVPQRFERGSSQFARDGDRWVKLQ